MTFWFCFFASWYQYSTAIADNSGSEDDEIDFMLNDGRFIGKPMRPLRQASAFGVSSRYSPNGKPLIPFVHAIMLEDSTHSMTHRETVRETDICVRARARARTHAHIRTHNKHNTHIADPPPTTASSYFGQQAVNIPKDQRALDQRALEALT